MAEENIFDVIYAKELKTKEDVEEYIQKLDKFSDEIGEDEYIYIFDDLGDFLRAPAREVIECFQPYLREKSWIKDVAKGCLSQKFIDTESIEDMKLMLPFIDKEDKRTLTNAFKNIKTVEQMELLLPLIDVQDQSAKDAALALFIKSQDAKQTELLLPFADKEDPKWRLAAFSIFLRSNDTKQIEMIMPILEIKSPSVFGEKIDSQLQKLGIPPKTIKKELNSKQDISEETVEKMAEMGIPGDVTMEILEIFEPLRGTENKDLFSYQLAEEFDKLDIPNNLFRKALSLKRDDAQYLLTEVSSEAALHKLIELGAEVDSSCALPMIENGLLHDEVEKAIKRSDQNENIVIETEYGNMQVNAQDAKVAYGEYYQRLFESYIEKMSEKDVYKAIKYIDSYTPGQTDHAMHTMCHCFEDGFMKDKDNRTKGNIILDKVARMYDQGRATSNCGRCFEGYWKTAKNNPDAKEDFKSVLEKYPHIPVCREYLGYVNGDKEKDLNELRTEYLKNPEMLFVDTIMVDIDGTLLKADGKLNLSLIYELENRDYAIYTGGDPERQRKILLEACDISEKSLQEDTNAFEAINHFKTQLLEGKQIYSKNAFTQENICLAKGVYDDTLPEHQGIKSLISYGLTKYQELDKIPAERKISAEKVLEIYQQKERNFVKSQELKVTLAQKNKTKASTTQKHPSNSGKSSGSNSNGGFADGR